MKLSSALKALKQFNLQIESTEQTILAKIDNKTIKIFSNAGNEDSCMIVVIIEGKYEKDDVWSFPNLKRALKFCGLMN